MLKTPIMFNCTCVFVVKPTTVTNWTNTGATSASYSYITAAGASNNTERVGVSGAYTVTWGVIFFLNTTYNMFQSAIGDFNYCNSAYTATNATRRPIASSAAMSSLSWRELKTDGE